MDNKDDCQESKFPKITSSLNLNEDLKNKYSDLEDIGQVR
jgi:hypothetical protein